MKEKQTKASPVKACVIFLIVVCTVFMTARYITDEDFRNSFDAHVLKKEVSESKLGTIEINSDANPYIFAYDKYINVLSKNTLTEYTSNGAVSGKIDVNISIPLMDANEKYFVLAEKDGQKIYLISGSNIVWQNNLEGSISKVNVNSNGYVSVILTNTTYKSVILVFSPEGRELFRYYLSFDYAICTDLSLNNEYLAIGEVDFSGTIVKSYVKIMSIPLAQTNPESAVLHTYESSSGDVITNIKFNSKHEAICMFNSYIQKVTSEKDEKIYDITENDLFVDINLRDNIASIDKQSSGLFSFEYELVTKSTENKTESLYILNSDVPKKMVIRGNLIGLNFGNQVQIINEKGWLVKKYTSDKEIKNIVLGNSVAGIIYKNRIEIIDL